MNKVSFLLITILTCTFFTSCLTIEESYKFNKNGSGWMQYKIETADLAELMEKFDTDEDASSGFDAEKLSMRNLVPGLEKIEGLSAIDLVDSPENNEYGVSFKFKSLNALNKALNHIMMDENSPAFTYFRMDGNIITREHKMSKNNVGGEFLQKVDDSEAAAAFLQKMDYKLRYSFKQSVRVAYSMSETSIIGKKSKELQVETDLRSLLNDKNALNTSIVLK
ncbi:MAG: hypothetical protein AAGD28_29025 [Bacteroidota bacterium]